MKRIRILLFPFALVYDLVTTIRNFLFDTGFFKEKYFQKPLVIAVGNLSVGGTGKSPQIAYLITLLMSTYKIATLSRGYKRKTKGFQLVKDTHNALDVGDEPLQFFRNFGKNIMVAVDEQRVRGINALFHRDKNLEVVLLDDAFQHRKVKANYYILLTKYGDLYLDDFLLPAGNLREAGRGAKRANTIIVTKCPKNLSVAEMKSIENRFILDRHQKLFFSSITYNDQIFGKAALSLASLKMQEVLLVTGIASPTSILDFLAEKQIGYKHISFPDHHYFTDKDVRKIKTVFTGKNSRAKLILTTEKDYMRLEGKLDNLYFLPIENYFLQKGELFDNRILDFLKKEM